MNTPDSTNLDEAYRAIRRCLGRITNAHSDGFNSEYHKKDLWRLKCWLDEHYSQLPTFSGESDWEKQRVLEILKKK